MPIDGYGSSYVVKCTYGTVLTRCSGKSKPYSTREYLFSKSRACASCTVAIDC